MTTIHATTPAQEIWESDFLNWRATFRKVYEDALTLYQMGHRSPNDITRPSSREFLASIGMKAQDFYDFIEDLQQDGDPDFETIMRISAIRRDYFLEVQGGKLSYQEIPLSAFPPGHSTLGGLPWLPRIIAKARAKLQGKMPLEIMYGCGADRPFLRSVGIHPAEFLQIVWDAGNDDQTIVEDVLQRQQQNTVATQ
jgi:hypothetical protein